MFRSNEIDSKGQKCFINFSSIIFFFFLVVYSYDYHTSESSCFTPSKSHWIGKNVYPIIKLPYQSNYDKKELHLGTKSIAFQISSSFRAAHYYWYRKKQEINDDNIWGKRALNTIRIWKEHIRLHMILHICICNLVDVILSLRSRTKQQMPYQSNYNK